MPTKTIALEAREHIVVSTGDDGTVSITTHRKGGGSSTVNMKPSNWMELQTAISSLFSGLPNEEIDPDKVSFAMDNNPGSDSVMFTATQRGLPEVSWDLNRAEWEHLKGVVDKMFAGKANG